MGLAIAFAISALVNLAFLVSPRTRETLLSSGRWLIKKVQTFGANPNTNLTFPDPPRKEEAAAASNQPPRPPPPPPPTPAIVWPTVRPSAPAPPPRDLYYGAKGIFETGKKIFYEVHKIF